MAVTDNTVMDVELSPRRAAGRVHRVVRENAAFGERNFAVLDQHAVACPIWIGIGIVADAPLKGAIADNAATVPKGLGAGVGSVCAVEMAVGDGATAEERNAGAVRYIPCPFCKTVEAHIANHRTLRGKDESLTLVLTVNEHVVPVRRHAAHMHVLENRHVS